jgi:hypothetical protein
MQQLEYIRTDKNGTKIFHDWNCPRCGGAGQSDKWYFTGKTCWGCGGSGRRPTPAIVKEYTPEYAAKLEARRAAREAKRLAENPPPTQEELETRAEETRRNAWESEGFRRDGVGYIHAGNTWPNKDTIKAAGGRWSAYLRAYITPSPVEGLDGVRITEVHAQDLCNEYGFIAWEKARDLDGKI